MNAVTLKDAQQNLEALIDRVIEDAEPTILCGDSGQQIVLLPLDEFNSWRETLYLLSSPANAAHLRTSMAEAAAGETNEKELIDA
jgi:antitoxin YefM